MKILSFTSIRSDYDLLVDLYSKLDKDQLIDFRLLVSGAHLSSSYGYSINNIKNDGFKILAELETLIDSDSISSRVKSASIFFQNSVDIVKQFSPDLVLFVGDREDAIIIPIICSYLNIPTIHFYGGDHVLDGNVDNPVRHASSKLATVHFVTLLQHKNRLMKMGEEESRIHVIGNISLDKIFRFKPKNTFEISDYLNINCLPKEYALLIFHPILSDLESSISDFKTIVHVLKSLQIPVICSYPNTDPGNKKIISFIEENRGDPNFIIYKNLPREYFMSIFYHCSFIIGNSSAGILEAASYKKPAINVGLRQQGRYSDFNVLFCNGDFESIKSSILTAKDNAFINKLSVLQNSYGNGKSADIAYDLIKKIDFKNLIFKTFDPLNQ